MSEYQENFNESDIMDKEIFESFSDSSSTSIQQILISLISDKENISLKTEIHNPKALASLYMLKNYFESINYPITANTIKGYIDIYLEYMVSNKRRSRKEVIKALSSWIEREYAQKQNKLLIGSEP